MTWAEGPIDKVLAAMHGVLFAKQSGRGWWWIKKGYCEIPCDAHAPILCLCIDSEVQRSWT